MISHRTLLVWLLLIWTALAISAKTAEATSMNLHILAGQERTESINLVLDDHVLIRFTVVGEPFDTTLNFSITYPNETAKEFFNVGTFQYPFVCDQEGEYFLHFSNLGSPVDKIVTLDYEVEHYIFGIPQMLFLVMIVVAVCLVAVAVFIFMGKPH